MKRKERMKSLAGFLAGVCVMGLLAGCGASNEKMLAIQAVSGSSDSAMAESYENHGGMWSESAGSEDYILTDSADGMGPAESTGRANQVSESANSKRKLIKTVNMDVETQEYEMLMTELEDRVKELGGYVQKLESYNGSNYYGRSRRNASLTIRIPQARLDEFVGSLSDMANIVRRTESVDDITLTYVDMQSHKEALQVEQERLLTLLERAEVLEDIITLENRLTNVRYQIESMESQLRTYDDQVDYSTVYLEVEEVQIYTVTEEEEETVWQRMSRGFEESISDICEDATDFGVWVVVSSPYLLIWAVVITVAVLLIRRSIRRKKRRKLEKQALQDGSSDKTADGNSESTK